VSNVVSSDSGGYFLFNFEMVDQSIPSQISAAIQTAAPSLDADTNEYIITYFEDPSNGTFPFLTIKIFPSRLLKTFLNPFSEKMKKVNFQPRRYSPFVLIYPVC
jgi:hypothetical protein